MAIELKNTPLFSDPNLVSNWNFDSADSSDGKGANNGTDTNVSYVAGQTNFGTTASFAATGSINVGTAANLRIVGSLSLNLWMNNGTQSGGIGLISKGNNSAGAIIECYGLLQLASGSIQGYISNGTTEYDVTTAGTATNSSWHMVTLTYNPGGTEIIYLDGTPSGTTTGVGTVINNLSGTPVLLGATSDGRNYSGKLDDVSIWNRVLTPTEINNLYTGNFPGGAIMTPNTGYWGVI